ncbi:MAG: hypothetical protein DRH15_00345 [Deltaproteobacteria bacterium]|nr:hypothetical protein [Deltaproteobacteria bacterium]MBW2081994.1 hypothetical protein [Deltaproteobacteria bacterium]RLB86899.1 MAG: hypothetical protein DRH15_00345 [Deltaproteobacteria bacterium]HDM09664.1 hypothetical protein [Desulfobacteraceae bacterium]
MDEVVEFFKCDECDNKDFQLVYSFSLRFHQVNFANQLIYDKILEETYQCTNCGKTFTKADIEKGLDVIKKKYRRD